MDKKIIFFSFILMQLIFTTNANTIEWEVDNRFPLFSESQFQLFKSKLNSNTIQPQHMIEAIESSIIDLSETAWSKSERRYKQEQLFNDKHLIYLSNQLKTGKCTWLVSSTLGNMQSTEDCNKVFKFSANSYVKYDVKLTNGSNKVEAETTVQVIPKLIISLGDSFASGEGNPDHPTKFNNWSAKSLQHDWALDPQSQWAPSKAIQKSAEWLDAPCHRSLLSWPTIAALHEALNNKHSVVQFASFACSGAEAYDGLITPQKSLVGLIGELNQSKKEYLRLSKLEKNNVSQQTALSQLLCTNQKLDTETKAFRKIDKNGLFKNQTYFGNVQISSCKKPRKVDRVYMSIGGNDVGFSGVVSWVMQPNKLEYKWPIILNGIVNTKLYKALAIVDPNSKNMKIAINRIPKLYQDVNNSLEKLNIYPNNINLMLYPDLSPIATGSNAKTLDEELKICQIRSREANRIYQKTVYYELKKKASLLKHDNANFGFIPSRLNQLGNSFILPLRKSQLMASSAIGWNTFDSQEAFYNHGICSGSLECSDSNCSDGNRTHWNSNEISRFVDSKSGPAIQYITDYSAYDITSLRGIRYGYDALLTGARLNQNGKLKFDWLTNSAHPTAYVHANIGYLIYKEQKIKR
ncbi:hypothetical protein MMO39_13230 [Acinetobacter modestus]|uniref:hypothetical protein n=1 Tax=Acinetobacter modestus TaxID=1776740 RepID=UPI001F4A4E74|nr:hypothetical protein [Acinetobacter modestus]MCH7388249.1 hypothetical protein [Acinetobacter modestus]